MNILMVHPHDLFHPAEPWTRRIMSLARCLAEKGHAVTLVYFPLMRTQDHEPFTRGGIRYVPVERSVSPAQLLRTFALLLRLARSAHVLHLQKCHHYAALPALLACYLTGTPLHYDWDDWEEKIWLESCGYRPHALFLAVSFSILERLLPSLADSVSCASTYLRRLAYRRGASPFFVKDSPVGVDRRLFAPRPDSAVLRKRYGIALDAPIVLYVGQLHGAQYVDLFIRAAAEVVRQQGPETRFMIVGDGYRRPELERLVDTLGLTAYFVFTGSVPPDDIPLYIQEAAVCVAPFKKTKVTICKSPLKIVEYMSFGKCVVASAVGEVVNMIGGCGYLAEEGSSRSIADGILYFLERGRDPQFLEKIKARTQQRIRDTYNWERTAQNLIELYEKIVP